MMGTKCEYQQRFTDLPDTRVTHTVSVVPVGLKFHENGTLVKRKKENEATRTRVFFVAFLIKLNIQSHLARSAVFSGKPGCFPDTQNIHSIHLKTNSTRLFSPKCVIQVILKFSSTMPSMCDKTDRLGRKSCSITICLNGNWKHYPEAWNEVSSLVVVCAGCGSLHRCAHSISVVLTDEDGRELPECSHVVGFKNLTLRSTRKYQSVNVTIWLVPQRILSQFLAAPRTQLSQTNCIYYLIDCIINRFMVYGSKQVHYARPFCCCFV